MTRVTTEVGGCDCGGRCSSSYYNDSGWVVGRSFDGRRRPPRIWGDVAVVNGVAAGISCQYGPMEKGTDERELQVKHLLNTQHL